MKKIVVSGGMELNGEILVSGSKNAALPIIFSCILTNGVSEIDNLPDIGDVKVALDLLRQLGAKIENNVGKTLIDTREMYYVKPDPNLASRIRASTYLLGSCLSRFGVCHIMSFGGCNFSLRPIDMHIDACLALGGRQDNDMLVCDRLRGGEIHFAKASVGATVNAILLAASAEGESYIYNCAIEPHIDALIDFLGSCGADIQRMGRTLHIVGKNLHGGRIKVIGDMIEAGSYLALGAMCGGRVRVKNIPDDDMDSVFAAFSDLGAEIIRDNRSAVTDRLSFGNYLSVTASPYPAFPTDLQPIFAPLMASSLGGVITDNVWRDRFGYLKSLGAFGIRSEVQGNRAHIFKSEINKGIATATDLRGGMACLITALSACGESEIHSAELILRGYENLEQKLRAIGADIKICDC